jgi:tetratricopeptide (TPR) repeat protein
MRQVHSLLFVIVVVVLFIPASVCLGQTNRYTKYTPQPYQSTYSSPDYNTMNQLGAILLAREEQNRQYRTSLIDWIFKIKSNTSDQSLNAALTRNYEKLLAIDNLKHVTCADQLDRVKYDVQAEVERFNSRQQQQQNKAADLPITLSNSANEKFKRGDYRGAIVEYSKLLAINSHSGTTYYYRALSYFKLDNYPPAIADLDQFIFLTNQSVGYELRGWAKSRSGDLIGALADFNKLIELNPSDANSYYNRGDVKSNLGDDTGAMADYNKSIALDPDDSMVYNNRGWSKYKLKRYSEAIVDLDKAIELDSENWVAYDSRSDTKYAQNNLKGCIEDCLKTISINPKCSNSYLLLGKSYQRQGMVEKACTQWSKAGELGQAEAYELIGKHCH